MPSDELQQAIAAADPFRGQGTRYLHVHSDEASAARANPTGAVVVPISLATTFQQSTPGVPTAVDDPNSFGAGYEYARTGNPTRGALERAAAQAEAAACAVAYSSGSAATAAVLHCLPHGAHALCVDDVYGGTQRYFRRIVQPAMGMRVDFVDMSSPAELPFRDNTRLVWLETPTNPTLKLTDVALVAEAVKAHNLNRSDDNRCILVVDNTFCSPYFQSPLALGADVVVHSATKYLGGHSDVVLGLVCTNAPKLYRQLRFVQNGIGAVPSPFDCFLVHRGLKTLHVRMQAACHNAQAIALYLEQEGVKNGTVTKVLYPGLKSHPQYELAQKQQHGPGAMITFYIKGGRKEAGRFLTSLRVFALAESLGAVESLAESPSLMTHASVPDDQRALLGIDDALVRLSIGIESCGDLIADLEQALAQSQSLDD